MRRLRRFLTAPRLALVALVVAGLLLRWQFVDFTSGDYRAFLDRWFAFLEQNGGFAALRDASFSNYNTPYLVLLAGLTYLPVPEMVAIKALSVVFDLVLAVYAYRILAVLRPGSRWLPVAAFGATMMLPTVVMNSSVWAQCDAIYVSFCLASFYFLIRRRPWLASVFFGVAFAFKLQAIFFLPVLVVVLIVNRQRVRALVAAPAAFLACLVPAMIAGRGLVSQLGVYPAQIANPSGAAVGGGGGVRGGRGFPGGGTGFPRGGGRGSAETSVSSFTNNAPTPYAWLPSGASDVWKFAGLALCAAVVLAFGLWLLRRRRSLSGSQILLVAAAATFVIPLLLPEMHERYFYLAEVLTVLAAFVDRRFIAVAAGLQVASISTYLSYLDLTSVNGAELIPLRFAALIAFLAAVGAVAIVVHRLSRPGAGLETVSAGGQNLEHVVEPVGADPRGADRHAVAQRQT